MERRKKAFFTEKYSQDFKLFFMKNEFERYKGGKGAI